jgi:hypothetical protein
VSVFVCVCRYQQEGIGFEFSTLVPDPGNHSGYAKRFEIKDCNDESGWLPFSSWHGKGRRRKTSKSGRHKETLKDDAASELINRIGADMARIDTGEDSEDEEPAAPASKTGHVRLLLER